MGMPISELIENVISVRLADPVYGINAQVLKISTDYGLAAGDLYIDFSDNSAQWFIGLQDPDAMLEDEEVVFPNISLMVQRSENTNATQGPSGNFSGILTANIYLAISHSKEKLGRVSTKASNCYEEAFYTCFCSREYGLRWVPGGGVVFARNLSVTRTPIRDGAENRIQIMVITMDFDIEVQ
jgi:hypothetical protein